MALYHNIILNIEDGVAKITLNRPEKFNSFNRAMGLELQTALDHCAENEKVRCVLITGAGKAFCAGQDLEEVMPAAKPEETQLGTTVSHIYNPIIKKIRHLEKPVLAAVNGIAAGAGANLALACDIVFASASASFVQAFTKLGLIPDSGGTYLLPRLIGLPMATAMIMLNDKISAEQAASYGMIYKVCESDKLMEESIKTANYLATQPTKGLGLVKRGLNRGLSNDLDAQLDYEAQLQDQAGKTLDYTEGVHAFLQKRKPDFKGK